MKSIRISNLIWEMLVVIAKKHKPAVKPEVMVEKLIKDVYAELR